VARVAGPARECICPSGTYHVIRNPSCAASDLGFPLGVTRTHATGPQPQGIPKANRRRLLFEVLVGGRALSLAVMLACEVKFLRRHGGVWCGWMVFQAERLAAVAVKHGERLLGTSGNPISMGITLNHLEVTAQEHIYHAARIAQAAAASDRASAESGDADGGDVEAPPPPGPLFATAAKAVTSVGSMLFNRWVARAHPPPSCARRRGGSLAERKPVAHARICTLGKTDSRSPLTLGAVRGACAEMCQGCVRWPRGPSRQWRESLSKVMGPATTRTRTPI